MKDVLYALCLHVKHAPQSPQPCVFVYQHYHRWNRTLCIPADKVSKNISVRLIVKLEDEVNAIITPKCQLPYGKG